jgi:hypothetical protein
MKEGFNLSRWALEHIPLTRYLIAVLLIGGMLSYSNLGPGRRSAVHLPRDGGAGQLAGRHLAADGRAGHRQAGEEAAGNAGYRRDLQLFQAGRNHHHPQAARIGAAQGVAQSWYQVRKKIGDIRGTLPSGVQGPFFNDEFGDTYGSIFALSGDGLPMPR